MRDLFPTFRVRQKGGSEYSSCIGRFLSNLFKIIHTPLRHILRWPALAPNRAIFYCIHFFRVLVGVLPPSPPLCVLRSPPHIASGLCCWCGSQVPSCGLLPQQWSRESMPGAPVIASWGLNTHMTSSSVRWENKPALSNRVATSHMWLLKHKFIKIKYKIQFLALATCQVLNSYMWLAATILGVTDTEHDCHYRKFYYRWNRG